MKTLEEIKDDYAGEQGRDSWEEYFMWLDLCHTSHSVMQQHYDEISKRYAVEVAKETQRNIADSADNDSIGKYIKMLALSESNLPNLNK